MSNESCFDPVTKRPRLLSDKCTTCIFRSGNPMHLQPGRVKSMVRAALQQGSQGIICHQTLSYGDNPDFGAALCRGFYDSYGPQNNFIRIMERLGGFTEVDPPAKEVPTMDAHWGWLTDYMMGETLRAATAQEWRRTADVFNSSTPGGESGAWKDENDRSVYVDGGPDVEISDRDIAELEQEAGNAGDGAQVDLCRLALEKDEHGNIVHEDARAECVRVILDNRMNSVNVHGEG